MRGRSDYDDEIQTHLSLLADRFVRQGMTPEEAAYAARRQFGNALLLKEARRDMSAFVWLETLWQDIRFGARALQSNPSVTAIILLTLMLGIGANAALFSIV